MMNILLASGAFSMVDVMVHHLSDAVLWEFKIGGFDLSITKRVMMMWVGCFFLLLIFLPVARKIAKNPYKKPSRFVGMMEVFINFIRKDVGEGSMGHHSKHYEPFLLTLFFFVLISNLLGLVPPLGEVFLLAGEIFGLVHETAGGGHEMPLAVKLWPGITATGDIGVTGSLAIISFIVIQIAGFAHQGIAYIKNIVPKGIPAPMWLIMWPIEFFGQFTKPFALAIRLLANMTAGHMIILVFLGLIFQFAEYYMVAISVPASAVIYLLELFVAFLQAYIFVFLTALFVAGAQHRH